MENNDLNTDLQEKTGEIQKDENVQNPQSAVDTKGPQFPQPNNVNPMPQSVQPQQQVRGPYQQPTQIPHPTQQVRPYNGNYNTPPVYGAVPYAPQYMEYQKKQKRKNTFSKFMFCVFWGIVFGVTASFAFNMTSDMIGTDKPETGVEMKAPVIIESEGGDLISTSISQVAKNVMPSVVSITTLSIQEVQSFFFGTQEYEYESSGSGIIVGKNEQELLIVTNNHVVEGSKELTVSFVDEVSVPAVIKGYDPDIDIAVLAVSLNAIDNDTMKQISIASLGDSDNLTVGEPAIAIGNALGYGQSVTSGIVSALNRELADFDTALIQTDAAINPGNSGGALLNIRGEVIGINTAKISADAVEGVGYAIPISEVKDIIETMMAKETREPVSEKERGYLGIKCVDVDETAATYYNMPIGAYVYEIAKGGAADKAGMKKGQVITKLGDDKIKSSEQLSEIVALYKSGEIVELTVQELTTDGTYTEKIIKVTLSSVQATDENDETPKIVER